MNLKQFTTISLLTVVIVFNAAAQKKQMVTVVKSKDENKWKIQIDEKNK